MNNTRSRRVRFTWGAVISIPAVALLISALTNPALKMCTTGALDQGGGVCNTSRGLLLSLFDLMGLTIPDSTWAVVSSAALTASLVTALLLGFIGFLLIDHKETRIASGSPR